MERTLAELYNKMANHIDDMIPDEWNDVYYLGEVHQGRSACSSVFHFRNEKSEKFVESNNIPGIYQIPNHIFMDVLQQLNDILLEIYDCFKEHGQALWEQMTLTFSRDGAFSIDFHYDVMRKDDGGQLGRELLWAYQTFGQVPPKGTFSWSVLNKLVKLDSATSNPENDQ